MGSSLDTVQFICDQAGLGARLTWRRMFGEYALYVDGKVVALVCDDQLFVKPTAAGKAFLGTVPEGSPYPGCRPFLLLSSQLDDPERLQATLTITADELPAPKPRTAIRRAKRRQATPARRGK